MQTHHRPPADRTILCVWCGVMSYCFLPFLFHFEVLGVRALRPYCSRCSGLNGQNPWDTSPATGAQTGGEGWGHQAGIF